MDEKPTRDDAHGGDGAGDGFGEREEPTKVIIPRDFLLGQLERQAAAHGALRDKYLGARARVAAGEGIHALSELREEIADAREVMAGTIRAIENTIIDETSRPHSAP